jgi:hypothetical protein
MKYTNPNLPTNAPNRNRFDTNPEPGDPTYERIRGMEYVDGSKFDKPETGRRTYDFTPDQVQKMLRMKLPKDHRNYEYLQHFKKQHGHLTGKGSDRGVKITAPGWRYDDIPGRLDSEGNKIQSWRRIGRLHSDEMRYDGDGAPSRQRTIVGSDLPRELRGEGKRGMQAFYEETLRNFGSPRLKPVSVDAIPTAKGQLIRSNNQMPVVPQERVGNVSVDFAEMDRLNRPQTTTVDSGKKPIQNARVTTDDSGKTVVTKTDGPQRPGSKNRTVTNRANTTTASKPKKDYTPKSKKNKVGNKNKKGNRGGTGLASMRAGDYIPQSMRGKS